MLLISCKVLETCSQGLVVALQMSTGEFWEVQSFFSSQVAEMLKQKRVSDFSFT